MQSKDQVQAAILKRLETNSGLDLKTLDVMTTAVSFDKDKAYATVAFHPKGDASLSSGMVMSYTLENRSGQWTVVKVGDSQGHSLGGQPAADLPPGHPPVDSANPHSKPTAEPGMDGHPQ
jgi:hypothetical protein